MKKILMLSIFYFLIGCVSSKNYSIKYDNKKPSLKQKEVIEKFFKKEHLNLAFDGGFDNQRVVIFNSDKILFDEVISTDNRLGLASSYNILFSDKVIFIKLNNQKIELELKKAYRFITVDQIGEKFKIKYSKV